MGRKEPERGGGLARVKEVRERGGRKCKFATTFAVESNFEANLDGAKVGEEVRSQKGLNTQKGNRKKKMEREAETAWAIAA